MSNCIFTYLEQLKQNNNRDWFHAHKSEYQEAVAEFEKIIESLQIELGKDDTRILQFQPKELTFKLMRDTRFSNDKSPYNPAFRCHISPAGKLPIPVGAFLFLSPGGNSFLGGGLFADMFKDATKMVRNYINEHGNELQAVLDAPGFSGNFKVDGTALKNVPNEYDPAHPMAQYLKYKSWYIEDRFGDELLEDSEQFIQYSCERFRLMKPFNDYLNRALQGFEMPQR